jgi:hypothetical protein
MDELTAEIVDELLRGVNGKTGTREIRLDPYAASEEYEFINNVFMRVLTSKGYKTFEIGTTLISDSVIVKEYGARGYRLEYQTLDFGLSYPKIYRSYFIGGRKVKRRANLRLVAKVLDPMDDSILWVGEASRSYEDRFPYGKISQVEEGVFEFNKPPRPANNWGNIVEPVVVSGIVVGLIYLFFSNQTDE